MCHAFLFPLQHGYALRHKTKISLVPAAFATFPYFLQRAARFLEKRNKIKIKKLLHAVSSIAVFRNIRRAKKSLSVVMKQRVLGGMAYAGKFPYLQKTFSSHAFLLDPCVTQ